MNFLDIILSCDKEIITSSHMNLYSYCLIIHYFFDKQHCYDIVKQLIIEYDL